MPTVMAYVEDEIKARLDSVAVRLGLDPNLILHDVVAEKVEELEELAMVMERITDKQPRRPIARLWKELGLDDSIGPKVRGRS